MSAWLLVAVISVAGADATPAVVAPQTATDFKPRPYHEYDKAIDEALRAEVRAADLPARAAAVRRLAGLYRELRSDPRLENSDTLKGYKAKLWSRLTRVKADLKRHVERDAKLTVRPDSAPEAQAMQQATQSLADQLSMMNYAMGGPGYVLAQTGGAFGGGVAEDNGQDLIDLIERTIRPDFWDTAGGPGSMFYYRPLMALVVRATDEVHGTVGGLLGALRQAGN